MIDPKSITSDDALAILEIRDRFTEQGSTQISGQDVDWWSDGHLIWFYNPGNDGDNTIRRFHVNKTAVADD